LVLRAARPRRYTAGNELESEESQFLSDFETSITIGEHVPPWLWAGQRIRTHPTVQLNHQPPLPDISLETKQKRHSRVKNEIVMAFTKQEQEGGAPEHIDLLKIFGEDEDRSRKTKNVQSSRTLAALDLFSPKLRNHHPTSFENLGA
jgi:hypothetical protein